MRELPVYSVRIIGFRSRKLKILHLEFVTILGFFQIIHVSSHDLVMKLMEELLSFAALSRLDNENSRFEKKKIIIEKCDLNVSGLK